MCEGSPAGWYNRAATGTWFDQNYGKAWVRPMPPSGRNVGRVSVARTLPATRGLAMRRLIALLAFPVCLLMACGISTTPTSQPDSPLAPTLFETAETTPEPIPDSEATVDVLVPNVTSTVTHGAEPTSTPALSTAGDAAEQAHGEARTAASAATPAPNTAPRDESAEERQRRYAESARKIVAEVVGESTLEPESTEGRPWGQPLKKLEGAPVNLG